MSIERAVVICILVVLALVVIVFAFNFIDAHDGHALVVGGPLMAGLLSRLARNDSR